MVAKPSEKVCDVKVYTIISFPSFEEKQIRSPDNGAFIFFCSIAVFFADEANMIAPMIIVYVFK